MFGFSFFLFVMIWGIVAYAIPLVWSGSTPFPHWLDSRMRNDAISLALVLAMIASWFTWNSQAQEIGWGNSTITLTITIVLTITITLITTLWQGYKAHHVLTDTHTTAAE